MNLDLPPYLLFAYDQPQGGMADCIGHFTASNDKTARQFARAIVGEKPYDYVELTRLMLPTWETVDRWTAYPGGGDRS